MIITQFDSVMCHYNYNPNTPPPPPAPMHILRIALDLFCSISRHFIFGDYFSHSQNLFACLLWSLCWGLKD